MSWYIRKAVKLGPLRLNLSKSGVGVSAGVKGARVGITGRGRGYVAGGRYGLYYRQGIDWRVSLIIMVAVAVVLIALLETAVLQ